MWYELLHLKYITHSYSSFWTWYVIFPKYIFEKYVRLTEKGNWMKWRVVFASIQATAHMERTLIFNFWISLCSFWVDMQSVIVNCWWLNFLQKNRSFESIAENALFLWNFNTQRCLTLLKTFKATFYSSFTKIFSCYEELKVVLKVFNSSFYAIVSKRFDTSFKICFAVERK